MIKISLKIILYVDIAFLHCSTGRQIFLVGGLIFLRDPTGTKACVTATDHLDLDFAFEQLQY